MASKPECLVWNVDPVLYTGPIDIRYYSLLFVSVFIVGWALLRWQLGRGGYRRELAMDFILWAMVGVVLGGWLGHQLFYRFGDVLDNPGRLVVRGQIRGLSSHGSTIGLVAAMVLFGRKHGIPVWEMIDRFSFSATGGAIIVRVGNFFNSEILGRPAEGLPWAVCFPRADRTPVPRHPSQIYEALLGLLVMAGLLVVDRVAGREQRPVKLMAGSFFAGYFTLRFFVELFKEHQTPAPTALLTMGQYLSIPFVLLGVVLIVQALRERKTPAMAREELGKAAPASPARPKRPRQKKRR